VQQVLYSRPLLHCAGVILKLKRVTRLVQFRLITEIDP